MADSISGAFFQLPVVMAHLLPGFSVWEDNFGGFTKVSYGDAVYTLITPKEAIDEIKSSCSYADIQKHPEIAQFVEHLEKVEQTPQQIFIGLVG